VKLEHKVVTPSNEPGWIGARRSQNIGPVTPPSRLYAGKVISLGDAAISYPPIGQSMA